MMFILPIINTPLPDLTSPQDTGIDAGINQINTAMASYAVPVNLTPSERQGAGSLAETRFPYAIKVMEQYAIDRPELRPSFLNFSDFQKTWQLRVKLETHVMHMKQEFEKITDLMINADAQVYDYMLAFYNVVKEAKKANVPGIDVIYEDLKTLFEREGNSEPTPPSV